MKSMTATAIIIMILTKTTDNQLLGFTRPQYNKWTSIRYATNGCYHEADFLYQGEVYNVITCTMDKYPWCPTGYLRTGVQQTRGNVLCTRWLLDGHKCYSGPNSPVFRVCVSQLMYYQQINESMRIPQEPHCSPDIVFLSVQPNTYTTYDPFNQTAANRQAYPYGKLAYPKENQTCISGYHDYDALYSPKLPQVPTPLDYKMSEMRKFCQAATTFLSSDILLINSRYGRQGSIFPCPNALPGKLPNFIAHFKFLPMCITVNTFLMAHYRIYLPPHLCTKNTTKISTTTSSVNLNHTTITPYNHDNSHRYYSLLSANANGFHL